MKTFTIIGGADGVGKTSFFGVLSSIRSDVGVIFDGATEEQKIYSCLEKGMNLTWKTTLTETIALRIVQRARDLDYNVRLYYIGINSADESIERVKNRVRNGGSNIPTDEIEREFARRFNDLSKISPFCNEVQFYDNENGFVKVAEYNNGALVVKGEYAPDWIKRLAAYLSDANESNSTAVFNSIMTGLQEALDFEEGKGIASITRISAEPLPKKTENDLPED